MEMAGIVCYTGANIITKAREVCSWLAPRSLFRAECTLITLTAEDCRANRQAAGAGYGWHLVHLAGRVPREFRLHIQGPAEEEGV